MQSEKMPEFLIIGIGGAGNSIIDKIWARRFPHINVVAVDTDKQALQSTQADMHILLGKDPARRWGEGDPAEAEAATREAHAVIERPVKLADCVIILAGLGRGAGSGAAPQIAKIARDQGSLVIAIVTLPFRIQQKTVNIAEQGLRDLLMNADSVIVVDNQRYRDIFSRLSVEQIYATVNELIVDLLQSLTQLISSPSFINVDYTDFHALFYMKGLAMFLHGECNEGNKNEGVVRPCLNSPSFDIDYRKATGCVVAIVAGNDFGRYDAEEITTSLTYELDLHADVIWGATIQQSLEGQVQVYAIMTGIPWKKVI